MCQYSAVNGVANDWHRVHYGARAVGGVGLVLFEATAVTPEGRISPADLGIWADEQAKAFRPITEFVAEQGAVVGVQLAHAGRKASTPVPWERTKALGISQGGWMPVAPSALRFNDLTLPPRELARDEIANVVTQFVKAAERSLEAGFQLVEIHMAHGYLLHEFLSPLSNHRQDEYGGTLENRMRLPLEVAQAVRKVWPDTLPLFVRISATDWIEGGWDLEQSVELCKRLAEIGVDLIDCSTGGLEAHAPIPEPVPGYQVRFADSIRKRSNIMTGAVGLITNSQQAEDILQNKQADVIFLGRELLRHPQWALDAAVESDVPSLWPRPYLRARPER